MNSDILAIYWVPTGDIGRAEKVENPQWKHSMAALITGASRANSSPLKNPPRCQHQTLLHRNLLTITK